MDQFHVLRASCKNLASDTLLPALPDWSLRPQHLYTIDPHNRHISPKVRAFIDFADDVYRFPV